MSLRTIALRRRRYHNREDVLVALASRIEPNDPTRRGAHASDYVIFGPHGRYAIYAIHTRFDAIEFQVIDVEQVDPNTGDYGSVVRQEPTAMEALRGLEFS